MNNQTGSVFTLASLDVEAKIRFEPDDYLPLSLVSDHRAALTTHTVIVSRPDESCLLDVRLDGSTGLLMSLSLTLYTSIPSNIPLQRQRLFNIGSGVPCFNVDTDAATGHVDRVEGPLTLHITEDRAELIWSSSKLDAVAGSDAMQWLFCQKEWCGISLALSGEAQKQAILDCLF